MREVSRTTRSAEETFAMGQSLGERLEGGDVVFLEGPLGAGKTQFAQGIANGLGVLEHVTSPTFTLVAEYDGRVPFTHMDLYRLYLDPSDSQSMIPDALSQIAFTDYLDGWSVVIVEWPSAVIEEVEDYLRIGIEYTSETDEYSEVNGRRIQASACGKQAERRLREWVNAWPS